MIMVVVVVVVVVVVGRGGPFVTRTYRRLAALQQYVLGWQGRRTHPPESPTCSPASASCVLYASAEITSGSGSGSGRPPPGRGVSRSCLVCVPPAAVCMTDESSRRRCPSLLSRNPARRISGSDL